jgi:wyosine [tRNA(Phe)-imidazoG37] synthetase (radical SAM superfamily)
MIYPTAVQLETLNFCNAKCVMCPATTTSRAHSTMSDAIFNRIVEQIAAFPTKPRVSLHGTGEPLLYKKLGQRIRTLTKHGIPVYITTNGSIVTRARAFELIDAGITAIEFSIESLNKEIFERIRVGLDLDEVIANFLSFVELRDKLNPKITIGMVFIAHDDNADSLAEYEAFFEQHLSSGDELTVVPRHNFASSYDSHAAPSDIPCSFVVNAINIQSDGIVNLCCVDSEQTYALGDLNKNTIVEIFNCERFNEIRRAHAEGRRHSLPLCSSCNVPEVLAQYKRRTLPAVGILGKIKGVQHGTVRPSERLASVRFWPKAVA